MTMLTRSESDRIVSGVCAGLAKYVAVEVTWIRIAFLLLFMASGLGLILYLVLALLMPTEQDVELPTAKVLRHNIDDLFGAASGIFERLQHLAAESRATALLLILLGVLLLVTQFGWFTGNGVWAIFLIGFGLYFVYRSRTS